MCKKEYLWMIEHLLEKENKKNNLYCEIVNKKEVIKNDKNFNGNYDTRLDEKEFEQSAVIIQIKNEKKEKVFIFTLFFIRRELYHIIYVWKKKQERLEKVSIRDYKQCIDKNILLLGYARFSEVELNRKKIGSRHKCIEIYINLIKEIGKKCHSTILVEPEGILKLAKKTEFLESIELGKVYETALGAVDQGGRVTRKLAIILGLKEIEGCYNYYTFGPVFLGNIN